MPSKVAIDPEEASLGLIRADFVPPLHSPAAISTKEPMAIVQEDPSESIQDGKYFIKNQAADIYGNKWSKIITSVHFWPTTKVPRSATLR